MVKECKIDTPERIFPYRDAGGKEWLGIPIYGCNLDMCDVLWIRSYRPRRGGYPSPPPPADLAEETVLRFPHCPERILPQGAGEGQHPNNDPATVWFGLDVSDIELSKKDLSMIQVLLIPCSTLEAKVPGFEGGFTP